MLLCWAICCSPFVVDDDHDVSQLVELLCPARGFEGGCGGIWNGSGWGSFCAVCTQSRFLSCRVGWWGRLLGWLLIWSQGWFPSSPRPRAMWRNKSFQSVSQTFSSDSKLSLFPLTPSKNRFDSSSTHCKSSGSETITLLSEKTGQTDLHIEVHETNKDC